MPQLWALLTDRDPYMPILGSNIAWASTNMNISTSMMYPFLSLLVPSEGVCRQPLLSKQCKVLFPLLFHGILRLF